MVDYNISAVNRRKVYTGSAGVGPYAFTFEILEQTDITVYKNATRLTLTTDYTVTINANGTGSVTLVVAASAPDRIVIVGARDIERTTDFVTAGDLTATSLNTQLDASVIYSQQLAEQLGRTLRAPVYDPELVEYGGTINMELPAATDRALQYLAFDAAGNPIASPAPSSTGAPVSTFMATVLDDTTAAAARTTLGALGTGANTFTAVQTGPGFDVSAITDIASAATTAIGGAATREVRITGTTGITSFGTVAAGIRVSGRFAAALTLTHNATSMILPGGANITTAADDRFVALSLGSGNWIVTDYVRASGVISAVAQGTGITVSTSNGVATVSSSVAPTVRATAQNTTSGTLIDFTGIPSTAQRIQIVFNGVSTNGTAQLLVQIGDSGGIETTGYDSAASIGGTGVATSTSSAGFIVDASGLGGAAAVRHGVMQIMNVSGNIWVSSHSGSAGVAGAATLFGGGNKTLSAVLDRVRLTTTNGTDAFDAGSVTIFYE